MPPTPQYGSQPPQVQEVQFHPDLLHQSQPGYYGGQGGEELYDEYEGDIEDELPGFMNSYVNKNPYYYTDLSIQKVHTPGAAPTIGLIPTHSCFSWK